MWSSSMVIEWKTGLFCIFQTLDDGIYCSKKPVAMKYLIIVLRLFQLQLGEQVYINKTTESEGNDNY